MKTLISFQNSQIPVYSEGKNNKALAALLDILEMKLAKGRKTVKQFLNTLDSIEIKGSEAILYSKSNIDTLALSLY